MKNTLLNKLLIFTFISALGVYQMNAQLEYGFDGATWDGWAQGGGGTGPWASVFTNSPMGELEITWPTTSKNAVMYSPTADQAIDASTLKFIQVKVSNNSSQVNLLRIRGKDAAGWFNALDVTITTDGVGVFKPYDEEITDARWTGTLENWQVIFRRSDSDFISDGGTVFVDNILLQSTTTLSTNDKNAFEFSMYPNPVKDVLNINTKEPLEKVEVFNLLGKSVLSVSNVTKSIDVSALSKSLYIVKLTSQNGVSTKKFVKQ
jgi:hypothetical protein